MHTPLKPPRGTALQVASHVGPAGSIVVNTDAKTIHVQDGINPGGQALAKVGHQHAFNEVISWIGFTPLNAALVGVANGVAPLDADGKVPASFLPAGSGGGEGGVSDAGQLLGQTLASNVIYSSLTTLGVLEALTVTDTISGSIDGNAGSADKLSTARLIALAGDATGSASFDGSGDIQVNVVLANANAAPVMDSLVRVTTNSKGQVIATSAATDDDIAAALGFVPVSQAYVDGVASNFTQRPGVRFGSTDPVGGTYNNGTDGTDATLTGTGALTAGGGTPSVGDRLALMGETNKTRNGIYKLTQANPWILTRDGGLDDIKNGAMVLVTEGTHAGEKWIQITANPITIGTSELAYTLFQAAATAYTTGPGIGIQSNKISNTGVLSVGGSTNQIVASAATGALTLSLAPSVTISGTMTAGAFSGSGAALSSLNAGALASGTVPTARLGSGTANSSSVLYGDNVWRVPVAPTPTALAATANLAVSLAANAVYVGANGSSAGVLYVNAAAAQDQKVWNTFTDNAGNWILKGQQDGSAAGNIALMFARSGTAATTMTVNATTINLNGAVNATSFTGDGSALTNLGTAKAVAAVMATGTNVTDVVTAGMGTNDYFRIRVGATGVDGGWAEIATADGGNEAIYVRQYSGSYAFTTITNSATLLDSTGNTSFPKTVTAAAFSGSGAALTALSAAALTTGQVPVARMGTGTASSTTVLYGDGTWKTPSISTLALTNGSIKSNGWAGTQTGNDGYNYTGAGNGRFGFYANSGVCDVYVDGNVYVAEGAQQLLSQAGFEALTSVNGSKLTNLNAANLATGQVPVARMGTGTASSSTALFGDGTWKAVTTTSLNATGALPYSTAAHAAQVGSYGSGGIFGLVSSTAGTDQKSTFLINDTSGAFYIRLVNDANNASTDAMKIARSGTTATMVTFTATGMNLALGNSGLQLNGAAGTAGQVLTSNGASAAPTWQTPTGGGSGTFLNGTGTPGRTGATSGAYVGTDSSSQPIVSLVNQTNGTNTRASTIYYAGDGNIRWDFSNDTFVTGSSWMAVARGAANVASLITFTSTGFNLAVGTAGLQLNGSVGTSGQVLTSNGTGAAPTWQTPSGGSASLTSTQIGFGSAGNLVTGSANFTFTTATNTISIGNAAGTGILAGVDVGSTNNAASNLIVRGGNGTGSNNNPGTLTLSGGDYTSTNVGSGGNATLKGGNVTGSGAGAGGNVFINGGTAAGAVGGYVSIGTSSAAAAAITERLRFQANGSWLVNGSAGTAGQVLTSGGASAVPTWATPTTTALSGTSAQTRTLALGAFGAQDTQNPYFGLINTGAPANTRSQVNWVDTSGTFRMGYDSDTFTGATTFFSATRPSGTNTAALITLTSTGLNFAVGTGALQLNGSAGTTGQVLTSNGSGAAPTWSSPAATALNGTTAPLTQAVNGTYAGYGSYAFMRLINAGLGTDNKAIGIYNDPTVGSFNLSFINDALTGQTPFMTVTRSGQNAVLTTFTTPTATFSGALNAAGVNVTGTTVPANGMYLSAANTLTFSTNTSIAMQINATNALGFGGANYGTAGQVLQSNGSGAAPTWVNVSTTALSATGSSPRSGTVTGVYAGLDGNSDSVLTMTDTRATSGTRVFQLYQVNSGALNFAFSNDALNSTTPFMVFNRVDATNTMSSVTITGGAFVFTPVSTGVTNTGATSSLVAAPGGTTSGNGGVMTVGAGSGGTTGSGGQLNLNGGAASAGASAGGGSVVITAGNGSTNATGGNGGDINLTVGGGGPAATGGNMRLQSAANNATASSGFITIITGNGGSTSGNSGRVDIFTGAVTSGGVGAINIKTGNNGGGASGSAQLTTGTSVGANSGTISIGTGNTNGGTTGILNLTTGNGVTTDTSTGAINITSGNAFGTGTPGQITITSGSSSGSNGADVLIRTGATTDTSTGAGNIYLRTNTTYNNLALFKSGKINFGNTTTPSEIMRITGPSTEASNRQQMFSIGDSTATVDGTSRVGRSLGIYNDSVTNALTFYSTSSHLTSLNGQNALNPIAFVGHSLASQGGAWSDYEIMRMVAFHATANGGNPQSSAVIIGTTTHSQLGALQVVAASSAGIADLYSAGHAFSRIRSSQTNSVASLFLQNATTGNTITDGFKISMDGNTNAAIWNYENGYISFGTNATEEMRMSTTAFGPVTSGGLTLGTASLPWGQIYSTSASIIVSDRNYKTDIEDLDEAELAVAKRLKKLVKKFRYKDAVAAKSDGARIHVGFIAQEVQEAFAAEGLNAADYGCWCEDTWYELDGEVVDEGTEGAVKKVKQGVRHDEIFAFIIAAL